MHDRIGKLSVCIVSHNGYGAIKGGADGFIGGIEWQTSLLAKWLAARGHRVSFVTWHEGGPQEEDIGGVRVLKICRSDAGLPGLRFFHPKWTGLNAALNRAQADVYYQNGAEVTTGQVALWCRRNRRPFVFSVASNGDCESRAPFFDSWMHQKIYEFGLRRADRIIAQTENQRKMLLQHHNVQATVIPMPCAGFAEGDFTQLPFPEKPRIVWLGRVAPVKRAELFIELAKACPEWDFQLAGPLSGDRYSNYVREAAAGIANLTLPGRIAKEDVGAFLAAGTCLCCTSEYEGFPNTFLEAWSRGRPVLTTFDPDSIVASRGLGAVAQDAAGLKEGITRLLADPAALTETSRRCREYYERFHRVDVVMPRFESVLMDSAGRTQGGQFSGASTQAA